MIHGNIYHNRNCKFYGVEMSSFVAENLHIKLHISKIKPDRISAKGMVRFKSKEISLFFRFPNEEMSNFVMLEIHR